MDTIKTPSFLFCIVLLLFFSLQSCKEDNQLGSVIIIENYGLDGWEKEGLIKGELFPAGETTPFLSNLISNSDRKIVLEGIIAGSYRFEYYVKPNGTEYWSIPKDTVFQVFANETLRILIE
jgi:hypothetical protein